MSEPTGWSRSTLGELVEPRSERVDPAKCPDAKYIGLEHVEPQTSRVLATIKASQMSSSSARFVSGDVLYGRMRPYLNKVVRPAFDGLASAEFIVLPPNEAIDGDFLWRRLSAADFVEFACGQFEGDRPRVKFEQLAIFAISVPPQREQRRIAEALDELLTDIDDATAELQIAKRKLALYRQSLLKSAVEGTLTADWRQARFQEEPGEKLLSRLVRERRERWEARQMAHLSAQSKTPPKDWRDRYEPGNAPDTASLPLLPKGWVYASIGQCFEVEVGATPSRKAIDYWSGTVPWVSSGEVNFSRIAAARESITEAGLANSSTQINPKGSVLLGMIGEGKTRGQVAILEIPAANNQNCAAIWVSETEVPPEFVYFWLWSRYDETRRGSSGNNQPALNKSLVRAMPVPIAPVDEMREIAERLGVQFASIEMQEREIDLLLRMAAAQRQNILRAAFSGQLVPQDPNDEPASVLLERIRAERQASAPASKRKPGRPAKVAA